MTTAIRQHAENYLTIRRTLGFKLVGEGQLLSSFVAFVEHSEATTITNHLCVTWTRLATDAGSAYLARRMRVTRSFARYLHSIDPMTEVPPADLFPSSKYRPTPHIYTDAEVMALLVACRELSPPSRATTFETLLGLLATTGMRVGEAMALDCTDVDWKAGLLTVRNTKFGKSREVLLHASVVAKLNEYVDQRKRLGGTLTQSFFVSTRGTRLSHETVSPTFRLLRHYAFPDDPTCPWRIHDFRHTFAVNTLLDWYRDGKDVASRLPLLSTYLGHVDPKATYWYLSAVPEFLGLAAMRLEVARSEQR